MDGRNYVPPVLLGTRWASISAPLMPGVGAVQGDSIWEGLTSSGFDLRSNSPFDASGSRLPRVRFVVAPDGTTRDAEVLWAADRFDHEGALKNVAAMRYAPGIVKGRAVSVPMVLDVSPQP
jgi:hypothetical protein